MHFCSNRSRLGEGTAFAHPGVFVHARNRSLDRVPSIGAPWRTFLGYGSLPCREGEPDQLVFERPAWVGFAAQEAMSIEGSQFGISFCSTLFSEPVQ